MAERVQYAVMSVQHQSIAGESELVWDRGRLREPHIQQDKAVRVRRMFDAIAPTYERVNTISSVGRDAYWRRASVSAVPLSADARVLDVACGTGDLARAFVKRSRGAKVFGLDFSLNMLRHAGGPTDGVVHYCCADALRLPFGDGGFDVVSCAFGIRNFQDLGVGFVEFHRVLKPGGKAILLEFSLPGSGVLRRLYLLYFRRVMPIAARLMSRDRVGAYRYLPESVISFPSEEGVVAGLSASGFSGVEVRQMTFGIVSLYIATKPVS